MKYRWLRSIHLISGALALPLLVMYGVSAVQMAHGKWFDMKPAAVIKHSLQLPAGNDDGRKMARDAMTRTDVHGEIETVSATATGFNVRVTVPGTVHVIEYDRSTGATSVRTTVAGAMGMLNRLHHAAGLWHSYGPLRLWAVLVALASAATVVLAVTGIWMWWRRREERVLGAVLLAANVVFSATVLILIRIAGW